MLAASNTIGLLVAPANRSYAGAEDLSCLVCQAFYCASHHQPHLDAALLQRHKLVEPSQELQENICPRHDDVMKMFCHTDQKISCGICCVVTHEDCATLTVKALEKQRELEEARQKIQHTKKT